MGVDVYSESGVLATSDEILKFVTGKNKKQVVEICQNFYDELKQESDNDPDAEWRKKTVEHFGCLNNIKAKTIDDLRQVLESVIKVSGEPAKYDVDTHVVYSEELQCLFSKIVEAYSLSTGKDLPYLTEVNAWGSSRYNGWDVPKGVACFIFDQDSCFERSMSDEGKNLKKVIGHCDLTEWTTFSC